MEQIGSGDTDRAIREALSAASDYASVASMDERTRNRLLIVIEELVSNALRHGGAGRAIDYSLEIKETAEGHRIGLDDSGVPFDPTAVTEFSGPDASSGGGVGLALVRAWSEQFTYTRTGDTNKVGLLLRSA